MSKLKFYKNYLKQQDKFEHIQKFIRYIKSVFDFDNIVNTQKDSREAHKLKTGTIFTIVF